MHAGRPGFTHRHSVPMMTSLSTYVPYPEPCLTWPGPAGWTTGDLGGEGRGGEGRGARMRNNRSQHRQAAKSKTPASAKT